MHGKGAGGVGETAAKVGKPVLSSRRHVIRIEIRDTGGNRSVRGVGFKVGY